MNASEILPVVATGDVFGMMCFNVLGSGIKASGGARSRWSLRVQKYMEARCASRNLVEHWEGDRQAGESCMLVCYKARDKTGIKIAGQEIK